MAATYAALLAFARSLREILDLEQHDDPLHKEKIVSILEKVYFIVTFLEDYSDKYQETLGFRKAAFEAQDFMDSYLCSVSTTDGDWSSSSEASWDKLNLDRDLTMASEKIDFIWEEMVKMKNCDTTQGLRSVSYSSVDNSFTIQATARKMVVGFDDDLISIKERLYEDAAELQIIPIVGMGGIGKTTLATRAYEDSFLSRYFDKCAWVTVSQEYRRREILSGLFKSVTKSDDNQSDECESELAKLVYQNPIGRRYLIVVDDIWSAEAWDDLKMIFPDDGSGSRILLTSRILEVASYAGSSDFPVHQMSFLNEDQSWELLQQSVFGEQSCPLQLVEVGKKIAKNCGGLPLTIVVVAGLLLSSGIVMKEEVWENISENICSREPTIALQCLKILCFSYDRLPIPLKPCFLYIAAFPEDYKIGVSKLIRLWVAEGFLKPNDQFKCLEDLGERNLEDLVNRSLLLVRKKGWDGKHKTVGIHDMLREICITKAEEEGFLHQVSSKRNFRKEFIENPYRRLTILNTEHFNQEWHILDSSVRSVLMFFPSVVHVPTLYLWCRHICVLDVPGVLLWPKIYTFNNLRYFDFSLEDRGFPVSVSKHPNLETIVQEKDLEAFRHVAQVPYEIFKMPKLRHVIFADLFGLSLYPSDIRWIVNVPGSDVQTMEGVMDLIFSEELIRILVNLKKLGVVYENGNWDDFNADKLSHLRNLEDLEITMLNYFPSLPSMIWRHAFPMGLKKLSLKSVPFAWENMTIIGSLPNLQVLKMTGFTQAKESEWTTVEGQFLQLKCFHSSLNYLAKWEVEKEHFPCLESLILDVALYCINEIPSGIGEIDTLQYIELRRCKKPLVDSAKQIQKHQHDNGNEAFRVRVIDGYIGYDLF